MAKLLVSVAAGLGLCAAAAAQVCPFQGPNFGDPNFAPRQVNISGATLFRAFFEAESSTIDFIDVDGDGCFGFNDPNDPNFFSNPCFPNSVDQLAPVLNLTTGWWINQNRAVGSLKGFEEFVTYRLCCDLPEIAPTDQSNINHIEYFNPNLTPPKNYPGAFCLDDTDLDGIPNDSGTPVCPLSIDLAIVDVPTLHVTFKTGGTPFWNRKPTQGGYGLNFRRSSPLIGQADPGPEPSLLESVARDCDGDPNTPDSVANFNASSPDDLTIYDIQVAFGAVVPISNRGTGVQTIRYSELQHGLVTGRMPSGENFAFGTRDTGSGTRNGYTNSLGVDASWGNGDNEGGRTNSAARMDLGPAHRVTNGGSSSHCENSAANRRLCISYTGLSGSSSAANDANLGLYEILNVIKDIAPFNATGVVRSTVSSILDNADPNFGYTVGGGVTFAAFGDPTETNPAAPEYMENQNAADYLNNITASVSAFVDPIPGQPDPTLSPGQFLATSFFLIGAQDALQGLADPVQFTADPNVNLSLQEFIRANSNLGVSALPKDGIVTPAFGSRNVAGVCPDRVQGVYPYYNGTNFSNTVDEGNRLSLRNRIAGDFNLNGMRDPNDIAAMIPAVADPNAYMIANTTLSNGGDPNNFGDMTADSPIPQIIGDHDGDGLLTTEDVRYHADGLHLVGGVLRRDLGFIAADTAGGGNYFGTTVFNGAGAPIAYAANSGWSRFDVDGDPALAGYDAPRPGAKPAGADGTINKFDLCYIVSQAGNNPGVGFAWSNLNTAYLTDLSADMNGDLVVNQADITAFTSTFGYASSTTCFGDLNCDGVIDQNDLNLVLANFNQSGRYTTGELTGDGLVDQNDLNIILAKFGQTCP